VDYLVLARKYRPQTFDEVVGQEGVTTTLRNAIAAGRVAHAYLFSGPRGVGKTTTARILAKALNCEKGPTPDPCNKCAFCTSITSGDDLDVIEIDAASNTSVDDVRALRDNVRFAPARARYKVYIVDEVHMLSRSAFNAFLKTLEEPPPHVKFVFCTTEPHRLPETIHSRCQRFDFRRISTHDIARRLKQICASENTQADDEALRLIARSTKGGLRDAETLLDQLTSYTGGRVTVEHVEDALGALPRRDIFALVDHIADHHADQALLILHRAIQDGKEPERILAQTIAHVRSLLLLAVSQATAPLLDEAPEDLEQLERQRQRFSTDALLYMSQVLWDALRKVKESGQNRLPVELAIVKLAQGDGLQPLGDLLARLQRLEARLGAAPPARPAPQRPDPGPPSGEKKKPPAPKAVNSGPEPAPRPATDPERLAEEHSRLQDEAAARPAINRALRILQGRVVSREK